MFFLQTVDTALLQVAAELCIIPEFNLFRIVGDTAVALQLGHRTSIDIDFFSTHKLSHPKPSTILKRHFPEATIYQREYGTSANIMGVKVDIFDDWHIPFSDPPVIENRLRLTSLRDLAIFKIQCIVERREKKDYIDLFYLFQKLDAQTILQDFKKVEPMLSDNSILFALGETEAAFSNQSPMPAMISSFSVNEVINRLNTIRIDFFKTIEKPQRKQN